MKMDTGMRVGAVRKPRRVGSAAFAGIVLAVFALVSCGDPWQLRGEIDRMVARDRFGGSLVRLYGSANDDDFQAAVTVDNDLIVLGSTAAGGQSNGLAMRMASDGSITGQTVYSSSRASGFTTTEWLELSAIYGTFRWMAGGWYDGLTNRNGMVTRLGTDTGEVIWIGTMGSDTYDDTVTDLAYDENGVTYAIGNSTAVKSSGSPMHASFSSDGGRNQHRIFTTDSQDLGDVEATANGIVYTGSDELLVVGTMHNGPGGIQPPDISYLDVMVFRLDPETGMVVPGSAKAYGLDGRFSERAWAVERINNPERYVVVGSTDWIAEVGLAWFVMIFDADISLLSAYVVKMDNNLDGEARAVTALPDDNYWERDSMFVVAGDNYESALFSPNVTDDNDLVGYGTRRGPDASVLSGSANAVVAHAGTFDGLFVVGTNADTGDSEGAVLWSLPGDLSSEPEMISTTPENPTVVFNVTIHMVETPITVSSVSVPDAVVSPLPAAYFTPTDATLEITSP